MVVVAAVAADGAYQMSCNGLQTRDHSGLGRSFRASSEGVVRHEWRNHSCVEILQDVAAL